MVGVPGKSKGCITCRRRKIRCDESKPTCNNCAKSGRTCEGYHREKTFVAHEGGRAIRHSSTPANVQPSASSSSQLGSSTAPGVAISQELTTVPRNVSDHMANDLRFFGLLMDSMCPIGTANNQGSAVWLPRSFQIASEQKDDDALRLAIRAFSVTRVGRRNHDDSLVRSGQATYGKALIALQQDLYSKETAFTLQTLCACRIMGLYELFDSNGDSIQGWRAHTRGSLQIIQGGGHETFGAALDEGVLMTGRRSFMIWSLLGRQETLLSRPEWKPSTSSPRCVEEYLSYLGLRLAALFSRMDQTIDESIPNPVPLVPAAHGILMELSTMEQELICWYNDYQAASGHPLPLYWLDSATQNEDALGIPGFAFRSNDTAHQIIIYWTLSLLVSSNMCDAVLKLKRLLDRQQSDELGAHPDVVLAPYYLDWLLDLHSAHKRIAFCDNIIRGCLYMTHERFGLESIHASSFPFVIILAELGKHEQAHAEYQRGVHLYARVEANMRAARQFSAERLPGAIAEGDFIAVEEE